MKKNDLIKKLQAIEGNPEIVLWNGMVGDWMPIGKLTECYQTRMTRTYWINAIEMEMKIDARNFDVKMTEDEKQRLIAKYPKSVSWECNEGITEEDIKAGRHQCRRVVFIDAKPRGIKTFDRLGGLEY